MSMNICPVCKIELLVADVDFEGLDIYGCEECEFNELNRNKLEDMEYYI